MAGGTGEGSPDAGPPLGHPQSSGLGDPVHPFPQYPDLLAERLDEVRTG